MFQKEHAGLDQEGLEDFMFLPSLSDNQAGAHTLPQPFLVWLHTRHQRQLHMAGAVATSQVRTTKVSWGSTTIVLNQGTAKHR